jgi:formate-dependent nitrite reductase membrane component NrfD
MNPFVVDPGWGWWIIAYFFLGGIAAGAYFTATLVDLKTGERGRSLSRLGYLIALPAIIICAILLTADLGRPERFWHMLFKSGSVREALDLGWPGSGAGWRAMAGAPLFKFWSPMSVGSWMLAVFGLCSALSLIGSLWPNTRAFGWLARGWFARLLQVIGCLTGFFIASYTGALLGATNQPLWSDTAWVSPLFLASSASTGIALLLLLAWNVPAEMREDLERADRLMLVLELLVFIGFVVSLGGWLEFVWATPNGKLLLGGTLLIAILLPLILSLLRSAGGWVVPTASVLALAGGLLFRYSILNTPPDMLKHFQTDRDYAARMEKMIPDQAGTPAPAAPGGWLQISPEDGRPIAGGPGADPGNRPPHFEPHSKIPLEASK